jgi:hypothetical protein
MIIKNICPYPKQLKTLGNLYLMPGEQADISKFTQEERNSCIELQEGFRKGEFICVGVGQNEGHDVSARLRLARSRVLEKGAKQPLVVAEARDRLEHGEAKSLSRSEHLEKVPPKYKYRDEQKRPETRTGSPTGMVGHDRGVTFVTPLDAPRPQRPQPPPAQPSPRQTPIITPERAQEILSRICISTRNNGKKCRRSAVTGYEYCMNHMPKEILEEYKRRKKDAFFQ